MRCERSTRPPRNDLRMKVGRPCPEYGASVRSADALAGVSSDTTPSPLRQQLSAETTGPLRIPNAGGVRLVPSSSTRGLAVSRADHLAAALSGCSSVRQPRWPSVRGRFDEPAAAQSRSLSRGEGRRVLATVADLASARWLVADLVDPFTGGSGRARRARFPRNSGAWPVRVACSSGHQRRSGRPPPG